MKEVVEQLANELDIIDTSVLGASRAVVCAAVVAHAFRVPHARLIGGSYAAAQHPHVPRNVSVVVLTSIVAVATWVHRYEIMELADFVVVRVGWWPLIAPPMKVEQERHSF